MCERHGESPRKLASISALRTSSPLGLSRTESRKSPPALASRAAGAVWMLPLLAPSQLISSTAMEKAAHGGRAQQIISSRNPWRLCAPAVKLSQRQAQQ